MTKFTLRIYRGEPNNQYWEEFEFELKPSMNVISALMEIQKHPVNKKGDAVTPVVWESNCLEEVCGACSMLVNGVPRQSCTTLIEPLLKETKKDVITLAPLTKFPLIRDLMVDRTRMFDNLKKVHAWIDVDDCRDNGHGPKISPHKQEAMYALSCCMTCGCCSESCPQVNDRSTFMGPAPIAQVELFNTHPVGKLEKKKRLHAMMEEGGVSECGNAQNCVRVCPKKVPLTDAIAAVGGAVSKEAIKDLFSLPHKEEE